MNILFSANISTKLQTQLKEEYPDQSFLFFKNIEEAEDDLHKADILVTYGADLNETLIKKAKRLQWIMVLSAGIDQLPSHIIQEKNIMVTNARGIHKIPMAEYAISMLLQVYRKEKTLIQREKEQIWERSVTIQEITGRTMLILGTGSIGQEVARLAKAFQMTTYGISRSGKPAKYFDETYPVDQLEHLLPHGDFVISVLPSTAETKGLLTYDHFKKMPRHTVFLNMGRGDLVTSDHLLKAVQNEEIFHAVLDVFEEEPLPKDHPFWYEERITITPHLSGVTSMYQLRALNIFKQNLKAYIEGTNRYINKIDFAKGY